jgi:hypothetical protein
MEISDETYKGEDSAPEYVLNPSMQIIKSTDDEIIVQLGSRSRFTHRIQDSNNRGKLADFVASFRSPANPTRIAQTVGLSSEEAAEYVEHLVKGKVLIPPEQRDYSFLLAGLGFNDPQKEHVIRIVGTGGIATAAARQVSDLLKVGISPTLDMNEAFNDSDVVIVAADRPNPALFFDADETSRVSETPWHQVYMDGAEVVSGPTFIPGETVNYYDFDTMDESSRSLRIPFMYGKFTDPMVEANAQMESFIADFAASWAVLAVCQHLWGQGSYVENHVMRFDLERMQAIKDRVLKLPRNPVDIGAQPNLRHPFL